MTLSQNSEKSRDPLDSSQDRGKEFKTESLLCRLKYQNNLPELPFDPKFLVYPLEPSRFLQYVATSLERNYKHELLTETDVGVEVDLIDPDVFRIDKKATLHPDDERLLEDEAPTFVNARKSRHQKSVSWLRKTEYISTELYNRWNKSEKVESRLGYNVKRHLNEEIVYRDRESQINAIEETFNAARKPIHKHYSKPNVHALEVLPVLPDFTLWRYPCAQVIFDDDPSRKNKTTTEQKEEVNQAMIRGMVDESGDHFVAYFLPTEQTKQLRRLDAENRLPYTEGAAYEYELTREYNWNVKNKTMANYEENYFFCFRKDGVYYNELETRVRLSKRRKLNQSGTNVGVLQAPKTRLIVHHRDFTDEELKAQTDRLYMLEHDVEGDEDEEEENADAYDDAADADGETVNDKKENIHKTNYNGSDNDEEEEEGTSDGQNTEAGDEAEEEVEVGEEDEEDEEEEVTHKVAAKKSNNNSNLSSSKSYHHHNQSDEESELSDLSD
ncbi:RNA polymerase II-associated factor 1 isoform 1 [Schistosoma japonicum]|uniref:RNA polymerase II-associated factor 1 homolog n=1 Tax=Schistosoma japonicum TaxID=6182 RepID=C1LET2_SCHJA|nr:RNA polymerase II-associated factor 1 like [Schistosoma japonicum]TNN20310.1 RNA polymerase II-associated factor 1 isoform 1 [Schistosoma japonicum]CAX73210.1 Putative DNA helicase INO80 [Schistosoma japonicum]